MKLLTTLSTATMVASVTAVISSPSPVDGNGALAGKDNSIKGMGSEIPLEDIIKGDLPIIPSGSREVSGVSDELSKSSVSSGSNEDLDEALKRISADPNSKDLSADLAAQFADTQKSLGDIESSSLFADDKEILSESKEKLSDAAKKLPSFADESRQQGTGKIDHFSDNVRGSFMDKFKEDEHTGGAQNKENEYLDDFSEFMTAEANAEAKIEFGQSAVKENKTAKAQIYVGSASRATKNAWAILAGAVVAALIISV